MKIATYNVNSIRVRLGRLLAWLDRERPDVVCLQELKVSDEEFPRAELEGAGWLCAVHGQKAYNGVAILSREPPAEVVPGLGDGVQDPEARLLSARVLGLRVVSVYVPNGQAVGSEKWAYKLAWMGRLRGYLERTARPIEPLVLCGDFNVAPEPRDVARPEQWEGTVLCHPEARAALKEITGWGLFDAVRLHHPEGPGPWTWWDYRMLGFAKDNGLRIDHVLVTATMAERCRDAYVARGERKGKLPSDHAPVVADFEESGSAGE